jgi:uncharacterized protein YggE
VSDRRLPSIRVDGEATREVDPDVVDVHVEIKSRIQDTQEAALEAALRVRGHVRDLVAERHSDARVTDTRIRVAEHGVERRRELATGSEIDHVVQGYYGLCVVSIRDAAPRAAELVAAVGAGDEYASGPPAYSLSDQLRTTVTSELEREAVVRARERAERLAEAAGCRLAGVLSIGWRGPEEPRASTHLHAMGHATIDERLALLEELRPEPIRVDVVVPVEFALEEAAGPR